MTTRLVVFALASLVPAAAAAQHFHHHVQAAAEDELRGSVCDDSRYKEPTLDPSQQGVPWIVTPTRNKEAVLAHFNQGMTLLYGFNYEGALRHFRRATALDNQFVMGWWGMAMAAGPNINIKMDSTCGQKARTWSNEGQRLAGLLKRTISPVELALANALPVRYAADVIQEDKYAAAMAVVWQDHQPDPNVGALYAESLMDLHPWDLYDKDHKEREWTPAILKVLTTALGAHRTAVGANHYWIHAVEAGPNPSSAEASATLLETAVKGSGHLRHMPSHVYLLGGHYGKAAAVNKDAIDVDFGQYGDYCRGEYDVYIENKDCAPVYYGHYYSHNLFFRAVSEAFAGQYAGARKDAESTEKHATRFFPNEPGLERYMTAQHLLRVALGDWTAIPGLPVPSCILPSRFKVPAGCHIALATWHWAQGMRYTTAPWDRKEANDELAAFRQQRDAVPTDADWSNNKARDVLAIAEETLLARISWADNRRTDAIEHLKSAVDREDALRYDEPPQWIFPVRESLGGAYLAIGDAENARLVFAADLERHKGNARSLYGTSSALKKLGYTDAAARFRADYLEAWKGRDPNVPELEDDDLWLLGMPAAPSGESPPAPGR